MSRPTDPQALGLSHVLTDLLPRTVHAPGGPERYTVSAVFTRRPSAGEIDAINGSEARNWLDRAQFPNVTVTVSDRRLEIANTNLDELAGGLAAALAGLLSHISALEATRAHLVADELVGYEQHEEKRWAELHARAEAIRFRDAALANDEAGLGLSRLLPGMLPSALGSDFAPLRYTVVAEFTRPPTSTELAMIAGTLPRQRLSAAGYVEASITTRDRRLEIHDTNLDELAEGLATTVDTLLNDISRSAAAQDTEAETEAARLAQQEHDRAAYVTTAAAAITFVAPPAQDQPNAEGGAIAPGRADLGEWEDEGGTVDARGRGIR
ncbi:MAG TPA: hypothetical protein VGC45_11235 [Gryllotalpicola sp.]